MQNSPWTHNIDPVAFWLGQVPISWYWLFYPVGFSLVLIAAFRNRHRFQVGSAALFEALSWGWVGVLVGGRLGYALLYNPQVFWERPEALFQIWLGGMSFHGALAGASLALIVWAKIRRESVWDYADLVLTFAPLALLLGRVGNFINGELYGRVTSAPWGMIFPRSGDTFPRHPSQLYESLTEGLLLFLILYKPRHRFWPIRGRTTGLFFALYGLFRMGVECFRQPDSQIGFLLGGLTLGQILSGLMMLIGIWILWQFREPRPKTG